MRRFRSVSRSAFPAARRLSSGVVELPRLYFPLSTPAAIGAHAVTDISNASATGSSSRSTVRSVRLYGTWIATNGLQPCCAANVFACATSHAGASDSPT